MYYYIQSFLIVLIETICCKFFYDIFSENKEKIPHHIKGITILMLSLLTYIVAMIFSRNFIVKQVGVIILTAGMMLIYTKVSLKKSIILSVLFQSLLLIADFITVIMDTSLLKGGDSTNELRYSIIVMLSKSVLFVLIICIGKFFQDKKTEYIKEKEWVKFLFFPVFVICMMMALGTNAELITNQKLGQVFWMLAFGLISINIYMFHFMQDVAKREYLLREKSIFELEISNKMQLYESITEHVQKQREIAHEYKNQIMCMQALCEKEQYEELKKYLQEMNGKVLHDLDYIDTNHVYINAVLNTKYQEAMEKDILVVCKINDLSKIQMQASDCVLLLSNVLNNAIEACEKCKSEKIIKMKCVLDESNFVLSVKNTFNGKVKKKGDVYYTTKEKNKENHGIGIKNIIKVIEKYQGYHILKYTEDEFFISIIIPQET